MKQIGWDIGKERRVWLLSRSGNLAFSPQQSFLWASLGCSLLNLRGFMKRRFSKDASQIWIYSYKQLRVFTVSKTYFTKLNLSLRLIPLAEWKKIPHPKRKTKMWNAFDGDTKRWSFRIQQTSATKLENVRKTRRGSTANFTELSSWQFHFASFSAVPLYESSAKKSHEPQKGRSLVHQYHAFKPLHIVRYSSLKYCYFSFVQKTKVHAENSYEYRWHCSIRECRKPMKTETQKCTSET